MIEGMFFDMVKRYVLIALAAIFIVVGIWFWSALAPVAGQSATPVTFVVAPGEGFSEIVNGLAVQGLIRSPLAFKVWVLVSGAASSLQPGVYQLDGTMPTPAIARALASNDGRGVRITIPEGSDIFEIDKILSDALVTLPGDFTKAANGRGLEGRLFPDTYQLTNGESTDEILKTFMDNFGKKAKPLFAKNLTAETSTLITASMLEKEAPDQADQRVIAGIIAKRLTAGIPLGIDATVCYAEQVVHPSTVMNCASLAKSDFTIDSPYNTYLHRGLPPGSIGNPGTSSIEAAQNPTLSPYWYYLSDQKTGKIIYAKTLLEQNQNIQKYLK